MKLIKKLWHNFKTRPDSWFFYGFLITFPFSIRKVLFFYPIGDQFNEYTGSYLYLSDIFLILTIIFWAISILQHKYNNQSSNTSPMFHVEQFTNPISFIPLFLVIWSLFSIGWADNTNIALFRSIKLLEFYLLYLYLIFKIVPRPPRETKLFHVEQFSFLRGGTFLNNIFRIIIFLGLLHAIFGIWQFIIQKSVGLFWLKESLISRDMIDVANIYLFGNKLIRAYGLFPHPNILGGFLLFSIISTTVYFKMFHPRRNAIVPRGTIASYGAGVEHTAGQACNNTKLFRVFVIIQFVALLLTFSKSAILGLIIALLYIMFHACLPAGRWNNLVFFWVEHKRKLVLMAAILVLLIIIIKPAINLLLFKSLEERVVYMQVSPIAQCFTPASTRGDLSMRGGWNNCKTLVYGLGSGQFVVNINEFVPRGTNLYLWQYQPVHNVFLLIWSELGIIGLILFIWWIWKLFHPRRNAIVPRGTIASYGAGVEQSCRIFKGILWGFIFIMLFDHYFWDIQQGQIMFWLITGLIAGISFNEKTDLKN